MACLYSNPMSLRMVNDFISWSHYYNLYCWVCTNGQKRPPDSVHPGALQAEKSPMELILDKKMALSSCRFFKVASLVIH